jgi:acyl carrier protein
MDRAGLETRLRGFLADDLMLDDPDIDADSDLVSTGLIDSVDLVRVATFLERESGITVPDQDINAENFDSIDRILDYCAAKLQG